MKYFTLIVLLALGLSSCKKDEVNVKQDTSSVQTSTLQRMVTGVNGPTSGTVNQELSYTLLWSNPSNQNYFDHINASHIANELHLKLFVNTDSIKPSYINKQLSAVFKFKADSPGTYYLKFPKPGNDSTYSIVDTVTIK